MTYLDKLLALRKDQGEDRQEPAGDLLKSEPAIPVKNSPKFPERHCSRCGEVESASANNSLVESDGYLWHRACLQRGKATRPVSKAAAPSASEAAEASPIAATVPLSQERDRGQQQSVTCWHCNRLVYRPRYLAWGKDLIPLHDSCVGAWIDAWDALLAERGDRQ